MSAKPRGFTLIELLVVISVVSVLVLMLSPVIRNARENARTTRCSHNLREIYFSMTDYAGDYRGVLPCASVLNTPPSYWRQLHHLLADYVGETGEVFHCPSDLGYHAWYGASIYFPYFGSSYQTRGDDQNFNHWLAQGRVSGPYHAFGGQPVDYYPAASRLGILRDGCGWHHLSNFAGRGTGWRAQCAFLDGHVELFSKDRPWHYWARIW